MALPLLPILGGIASVVGGLFGGGEQSAAREEAAALLKQALTEYEKAGVPPDQSLPLVLQKFTQQGIITPELEKEIKNNASKVGLIQEAPELREAQMVALEQLKQVSRGGLRPEDRAAFNQLRAEAERSAEGKRQQIMQNMMARGVGGSGAELAAQLQASQAGANALASKGDELSAIASQRALQALGQVGTMAGQVRGQDFDVNRTRAEAEDMINKLNTENARQVQSRNVGSQNQAQQLNLANKQQIANANVSQENQETKRQSDAVAQHWKDLLSFYSGKAGMYKDQASGILAQGKENAARAAGIGGSVGGILSGIEDNRNRQADRELKEKELKYKYGD